MKVLILKPSSLGDVVHALPVLRALKKRDPASEVYWWLERGLFPLLEGDPDVTGLIPFDRAGWNRWERWREAGRMIGQLRRHRFDWVIDLQALARSGLLAWLAGGGLTIGLEDWREGAPGFYELAVPRPSPHTHAVDWYLGVLDRLGIPVTWDFEWLPPRPAAAAAIRARWPVESARWVLLQPGGRWETKRWPVEFYAELVRGLAADCESVRFAVLGNASEAGLGAVLCRSCPGRCLNLAGQIGLGEMIEWIRAGALMVTNDTGPLHVAAALGTPLVALFGPTDPRRTGPYGRPGGVLQSRLPCLPCLKSVCGWSRPMECLRSIAPATVVARAREVLASEGLLAGCGR